MPALKVATPLNEDESELSQAAVRFLHGQQLKPVEDRLSDIELWQIGANEYLAGIAELRDLLIWFRGNIKRWTPIIGAAIVGSGVLGPHVGEFVMRLLKAAGY